MTAENELFIEYPNEERQPHTPELTKYLLLKDLMAYTEGAHEELHHAIENSLRPAVVKNRPEIDPILTQRLQTSRSQVFNARREIASIRIALSQESQALEDTVIKQIKLTDEEKKAIEETINDPDSPLVLANKGNETKTKQALEEFLTRVFQLNYFAERVYYDYWDLELMASSAYKYSDLLEEFVKTPDDDILKSQVEVLKGKIKDLVDPEEFGEDPDVAEEEQEKEVNLTELQSFFWGAGIPHPLNGYLLDICQGLDEKDIKIIKDDTTNADQTALVLARKLGKPLDSEIASLALVFRGAFLSLKEDS